MRRIGLARGRGETRLLLMAAALVVVLAAAGSGFALGAAAVPGGRHGSGRDV